MKSGGGVGFFRVVCELPLDTVAIEEVGASPGVDVFGKIAGVVTGRLQTAGQSFQIVDDQADVVDAGVAVGPARRSSRSSRSIS